MSELPVNQVLCGDCYELMTGFPPDFVDLVVTSPPYWGLRNYGEAFTVFGGDPLCQHEWVDTPPPRQRSDRDVKNPDSKQATVRGSNYNQQNGGFCEKCGAWKGQLGLEPHPQMFIDHLVEFGRLVRQVLKPSGLFWLNLGDTYCNIGKWVNKEVDTDFKQGRSVEGGFIGAYSHRGRIKTDGGWLQPKQLLMIPSRVACALQDDGWILRSDVIWYKPNHMPESVTDRFTKSYEHFFMFSKEQRYYFNLDEIREKPISTLPSGNLERKPSHQPKGRNRSGRSIPWTPYNGKMVGDGINSEALGESRARNSRLLANTGENNKVPYKGNNPHLFRINEGREAGNLKGKNPGDVWEIPTQPFPGSHFAVFPKALVNRIIKCSSPPKGVVLDPFAGSGTTLRVARKLGRRFIGIELNPEYVEMAERRLRIDDYRKTPENVEDISKYAEART